LINAILQLSHSLALVAANIRIWLLIMTKIQAQKLQGLTSIAKF
jgi:hypothetical protein